MTEGLSRTITNMERDCSLKVDGNHFESSFILFLTRWDEQPPSTHVMRYVSCFDVLTDFQFSNTINSAE